MTPGPLDSPAPVIGPPGPPIRASANAATIAASARPAAIGTQRGSIGPWRSDARSGIAAERPGLTSTLNGWGTFEPVQNVSRAVARIETLDRSPGPITRSVRLDLEVDEPVRIDRPHDDLDRGVAIVVDEDVVAAGLAAARGRRDDLGGRVRERVERDAAFLDRPAARIRGGLHVDAERERAGPRERGPGRGERDRRLAVLAGEQRQERRLRPGPLGERPDDREVEPVDDRALVAELDRERGLLAGVDGEGGGFERREHGHGRESTAPVRLRYQRTSTARRRV